MDTGKQEVCGIVKVTCVSTGSGLCCGWMDSLLLCVSFSCCGEQALARVCAL